MTSPFVKCFVEGTEEVLNYCLRDANRVIS